MKGRATQVDVANALGIDQTTVSRWKRGIDSMPAFRVPQLEALLRIPSGALWAAAGLLKAPPVVQAIYADDRLDARGRDYLSQMYEVLAEAKPDDPQQPSLRRKTPA
jgi:transcriptional regulator with XRE-family HTH domain